MAVRDCSKKTLEYFSDKWMDGEAFSKKLRLFANKSGITNSHALWMVAHFGATFIDEYGAPEKHSSFADYFEAHMEALAESMDKA